MRFWRPMLAGTYPVEEIDQIPLPALVSIKRDGIRAQAARPIGIKKTYLYSRKGILIPNNHIQKWAANLAPGLEGELMIWEDESSEKFAQYEKIESGVMSMGGKPDFVFLCFDYLRNVGDRWLPKKKRLANLQKYVDGLKDEWASRLHVIKHELTRSHKDIEAWLDFEIDNGGEGLMVADPNGTYKFGRSTGSIHDRGLMKLKPWYDDEALAQEFSPLQKNGNALLRDEHGLAKRSSHKAGKTTLNTLGTIHAWSKRFGHFDVGSGFTSLQRQQIWTNKKKHFFRPFTFKYRGITKDGKPRHPIFHRFCNA